MPCDPSSWTAVEAIGTSAAAAFAGWQILRSRQDANQRAVFEHLREVERRLQEAWAYDLEGAQRDALAYFGRNTTTLSPAARAYLGLINSLDLLALAIKKGLVTQKVVDEHIATLANPQVLPLSFLKALQDACGDNKVYEHLYAYIAEHLASSQKPRR